MGLYDQQRCRQLFRRKPWLNWLVVVAPPVVFFHGVRLAALRALLTSFAPHANYSTKDVVAGLLLGTLEDLLVVALLVAALVVLDLVGRYVWHTLRRCVGDRYRTLRALDWAGSLVRFVAVLTLIGTALLPFAVDMARVGSHHVRRSLHGPWKADVQSDSLIRITMVGTVVLCVVLALSIVCVVDRMYWWPGIGRAETDKTLARAPSFSTPTYLDLGFSGYSSPHTDVDVSVSDQRIDSDDDETNPRHVTIVSAPSTTGDELESEIEQEDEVPRTRPLVVPKKARPVLAGGTAISVFVLAGYLVHTIAQDASPLVAAIALNATLNEVFHVALSIQLQPAAVSTVGAAGLELNPVASSRSENDARL